MYYSREDQVEKMKNFSLFQHATEDKTCTTDTMTKFTGENFGLAVLDTGCHVADCGKVFELDIAYQANCPNCPDG